MKTDLTEKFSTWYTYDTPKIHTYTRSRGIRISIRIPGAIFSGISIKIPSLETTKGLYKNSNTT